jgi:protein O-GlcNAc transferase
MGLKSDPSVTIGIPVYNEEKYVEETINSAINQTYNNLKIIISDNCSTDNTFEIIKGIVSKHENVIAKRQLINIGAAENFRYLSQNANTDFFCWLSGHDILHKDYITDAVRIFKENPELSLVYPKSKQIDEKGTIMSIDTYSDIETTNLDFIRGPLKVANNLIYGTPVHGLFKTKFLKEYKFKSIIGGDFTILYHASVSGKIFQLTDYYHFLREVRKETKIETLKRYDEVGLKTKYSNPYTEMCKEYLVSTLLSKRLRLLPKIKMLLDLAIILKTRYNSPYLHNSIKIYSLMKRVKRKILRK